MVDSKPHGYPRDLLEFLSCVDPGRKPFAMAPYRLFSSIKPIIDERPMYKPSIWAIPLAQWSHLCLCSASITRNVTPRAIMIYSAAWNAHGMNGTLSRKRSGSGGYFSRSGTRSLTITIITATINKTAEQYTKLISTFHAYNIVIKRWRLSLSQWLCGGVATKRVSQLVPLNGVIEERCHSFSSPPSPPPFSSYSFSAGLTENLWNILRTSCLEPGTFGASGEQSNHSVTAPSQYQR